MAYNRNQYVDAKEAFEKLFKILKEGKKANLSEEEFVGHLRVAGYADALRSRSYVANVEKAFLRGKKVSELKPSDVRGLVGIIEKGLKELKTYSKPISSQ